MTAITTILKSREKFTTRKFLATVEPPNKGHFGSGDFVLYLEALLWWEVRISIISSRVIPIGAVARVLYLEIVLWWEAPLYLYGIIIAKHV